MPKHVSVVATVVIALGTLLALAAPAAADTTADIATPSCCVSDTMAFDTNVYALSQTPPGQGTEAATLIRIDPATNQITGSLDLLNGPPSGNALDVSSMVGAAGSIWVTAYFENVVQRIDPVTMRVTATISTGRSPSSIVSDGKSVWVALNNAHSVIRLDTAHNRVVQTVQVGGKDSSDSPWQLAYDGTQLLASLPGSGRVARIDPGTGKVRYDNVGYGAASCAHILPVSGGYWLDDTECSFSYFHWDARRSRITTEVDPSVNGRHDWGAVVANNALYTGEFDCDDNGCFQGHLVKRDVVTGAEIAEQDVGIEAFLPHFAAGSFWAADFDLSTLHRVANF
jgi:YVTN family beta-propeller protein